MSNRRGVLCNGVGAASYQGFCTYANWYRGIPTPIQINRSAGGNLSGKAVWDNGTYLDSNGELINPVPSEVVSIQKVLMNVPSSPYISNLNFAGETWYIEWTGSATLTVSGAGTGATLSSVNANKSLLTFGSNPTSVTPVWTITNRNDPPRLIKIYPVRNATNVANGELFNPDWIAEIKNFGVLRLMDLMGTNNSCIVNFSQLADINYYVYSANYYDTVGHPLIPSQVPSDTGPKGGMHPQLVCELARVTGIPKIQVCIPPYASDSLITQFATYMRDNLSSSTIPVYGLGNEPWNPQFNQFSYGFYQGAKIWGILATTVTKGTITRVVKNAHGLTDGGKADLYCSASGWSSLRGPSNVYVKVIDVNTVDLYTNSGLTTGLDTSALPAWDGSETLLSQDFQRGYKWVGKRSCEMMKIVRDLYNNRTRWEGALETQSSFPSMSGYIYQGVDYYLASVLSPANSLVTSDLFNGLYATTYFGIHSGGCKTISNITQANPGKVTITGHGFSNGATLKIFIQAGMTQLNNQKVTITVVDADNFTIGVDTTGYSAWTSSGNQNYCAPSAYWDLMDQSIALNGSTPGTYPTKYTYFNQQIAQGLLTGSNSFGISISVSVADQIATAWPPQYTLAKGRGLELRAYEGGCHFLGDDQIAQGSDTSQFNEFLVNFGHSAECAAIYKAAYLGFVRCGGRSPSKFVDAGTTSRFGTWGGIRYWKTIANSNVDDTGNPVWLAVRDWNDNLQPETWSARYGA